MNKTTLTAEQTAKIDKLLETCNLPVGLGKGPEEACSIAAINLALTGRLTDNIPPCMSLVIGKWIIRVQDRMPNEIRNSREWKSLLSGAAGTGRLNEKAKLAVIMDHLFTVALPIIQPIANKYGFGKAWKAMLVLRTEQSCRDARKAAYAAADSAAYAAAYAAAAADSAAYAAYAAADSAAYAAAAAYADAKLQAKAKAWSLIDPVKLLRDLIEA